MMFEINVLREPDKPLKKIVAYIQKGTHIQMVVDERSSDYAFQMMMIEMLIKDLNEHKEILRGAYNK